MQYRERETHTPRAHARSAANQHEETAMSDTATTLEISDYFTAETYTGYGLIKATNAILRDLGIDKVLPGPMGYTYLKKGYVTGTKDVKACTGQQGAEWASKYVAKLVAKATPVTVTEETEMTEPLELEV